MRESGVDLVLKYGWRGIQMDSTFGTNNHRFPLFTLLVVDDWENGIPVAWFFCSRELLGTFPSSKEQPSQYHWNFTGAEEATRVGTLLLYHGCLQRGDGSCRNGLRPQHAHLPVPLARPTIMAKAARSQCDKEHLLTIASHNMSIFNQGCQDTRLSKS